MNRAALTGTALVNMLKQAVRHPVWAVTALVAFPFRYGKAILGGTLLVIVILLFVVAGRHDLLIRLGIEKDGILWHATSVIIGIATIYAVFALISNPLIASFGALGHDTHGSARLANRKEVAPLRRELPGLLIGRDSKTGKLLRYSGPAHLLTMAPTRTGKGVGTIIPNLLTANRSVICIDPKGENARITRRAREAFGPVYVLDPFDVTGFRSSAFNPLDAIDIGGLDAADDANYKRRCKIRPR